MMSLATAYRCLLKGATASPQPHLTLTATALRACASNFTAGSPITRQPANSALERIHSSPSQGLLTQHVRKLSTTTWLLTHSDYYKIKKDEAGKFTMPRMWEVPDRLLDREYWRHPRKGGRGEDGRIKIRHIGGGHQRNMRIVDHMRAPPLAFGEVPVPVRDRIMEIGYDPFRSGHIALVAGTGMDAPKLILAADELKVGDIITAYRGPPKNVMDMRPGDAYPLKHLPVGTKIHHIEHEPGGGGTICRSAGSHYLIIRKRGDQVVVQNPMAKGKGRVHDLHEDCLAVIGRVSNPDHGTRKIGKAGRSRWMNIRPKGQTGKDRWHHRNKGEVPSEAKPDPRPKHTFVRKWKL